MATYVLLTRLSPTATEKPRDMEELGRQVTDKIHQMVPDARWVSSYAVMGPYDYLDIFEAPDERTAAKVALIIRSFGHATTEMWTATPWEQFVRVLREMG